MPRVMTPFLVVMVLPTFLSLGLPQQALNPQATRPVLVDVFDLQGNAVRDLTAENFHVKLNGKSATVLGARYSLAPRRIVVLLDMSGSMAGESGTEKWRIAREAVEDLLAQTPDIVPIAMLTFSGQVGDVFDFHQSRAAIASWLKQGPSRRVNLKHATALFDTILDGLKLLQPFQPGDALYAITDGGDNASHASSAHAKVTLLESGVRLFAFLFREALPRGGEQAIRDSFLEMVTDSGGVVLSVSGHRRLGGEPFDFEYDYDEHNREKVRVYTQELIIQVNGFWTLELVAPSFLKKGSKITLEVVDSGGRLRKDVGISYPRVLPASK